MIERLNTTLSDRYTIERELGEGGMATVFLADDVKHNRKVAIKVLKPELAAVVGSERFLTEIRTTANLQHPHILPLFDSGEADGFLYYVMPYVEGESLRDRLERVQELGVDEAVRIARDVAEALDYAHRGEVIHRDIKPANILLHDGRPLVADFGIALAVSQAGGGRLTETGLSLGTPHYMSPEQASADREVTPRSDVYSLASVLYEMLAGHPPHTGPGAQSVLVKILTEDPRPVTELRRTVPAHVAAAVMKGLEKLPADRFPSARAFADALDDPAFTWSGPAGGPGRRAAAAPDGPAWRWGIAGAAVGAAAGAGLLAVGLALLPDPPRTPAPTFRTELVYADSGGHSGRRFRSPALSPDGSNIVFLAPGGEAGFGLLRRSSDDRSLEWIPGAERGAYASFSPDGERIVFSHGSGGRLRVVPSEGGPPTTLSSGGNTWHPHWGTPETIVYASPTGIRAIPSGGGESVLLVEEGLRDGEVTTPHLLPDGQGLLFTLRTPGGGDERVMALDLRRDSITEIGPGYGAQYLASGHLVYARDRTVFAAPFDPGTLEITGPRVAVLRDIVIERSPGGEKMYLAASESGTVVYATADQGQAEAPLTWIELDGEERPLRLRAEFPMLPRVSPDGRRVLYQSEGHIWIYDDANGANTRLTEVGANESGVWSPAGDSVYFASLRSGTDDLDPFVVPVDGSAEPRLLYNAPGPDRPASISPDGRLLLVQRRGEHVDDNADVALAELGGDTVTWEPFLRGDWREWDAAISPDGRWVAYGSEELGNENVHVRTFPDGERDVRVSPEGAVGDPVWAPDGSALYYVSSGRELRRVEVDGSGVTFEVGEEATAVAPWTYYTTGSSVGLDIHPDGERLIAVGSRSNWIHLWMVVNWFDELRRLVDAGG